MKNKELRKFNLFQTLDHILAQFNRNEARSLDVICDLIRKQRSWSKYVDDIWQEGFRISSDLPLVEKSLEHSNIWTATSSNSSKIHTVSIVNHDMGGIPTCDCNQFKSTLIPCAGICAVFSRLDSQLFSVSNLHIRWRLNRHPLYEQALKKLKLIDSTAAPIKDTDTLFTPISNTMQSQIDLSAYNSIVYPTRSDVRYTRLNNLFKSVEPVALRNEHLYKLLMINLTAFKNSAFNDEAGRREFLLPTANKPCDLSSQQGNGENTMAIAVRPPAKRGKTSHSDANQ